jgi:serine/threonine protein phosphatase 1
MSGQAALAAGRRRLLFARADDGAPAIRQPGARPGRLARSHNARQSVPRPAEAGCLDRAGGRSAERVMSYEARARIELADWRPAPFELAGETVFAVGDVHGCDVEFDALLAAIAVAAAASAAATRLIYLGDMIDRGPGSLNVLRRWAEGAAARGVDRLERVMGNHEQLLLLAIGDGPHAAKARAMWLGERMGGGKVLDEMRQRVGDPRADLSRALVAAALGDELVDLLAAARSHVWVGNALFVHGGLDPRADADEFLSRPWSAFIGATWAWIMEGFLDWQGGFGGKLVVHGHTPPPRHRELTGQDDPHEFLHDRLGLDGGSARSGIVTAAQIENGRYRILRAGTLLAPSRSQVESVPQR